MPFDELFDDAECAAEMDEVFPDAAELPGANASWDGQHAEDRLLGELQAWAVRRGFDRRQRRVLSEALLLAFDRMPELPELATG